MKELCAVKRICRMERYFDEVRAANGDLTKSLLRKLRTLEKYMDSGVWLKDYIYDERGMLPHTLKRGVLSEDGLYNLLCEYNSRSGR